MYIDGLISVLALRSKRYPANVFGNSARTTCRLQTCSSGAKQSWQQEQATSLVRSFSMSISRVDYRLQFAPAELPEILTHCQAVFVLEECSIAPLIVLYVMVGERKAI